MYSDYLEAVTWEKTAPKSLFFLCLQVDWKMARTHPHFFLSVVQAFLGLNRKWNLIEESS